MSEQQKHMPGPWVYRPEKYDDWGWIRGPDGYIVAHAKGHVTEEEKATHRVNRTDPFQANARLIAAAPDLLEALKEAVEFAEQDHHALTPAGENMLGAWRAAIAKATGEE